MTARPTASSSTLLALTSAAVGLPGVSAQPLDNPTQLSAAHHRYRETSLAAGNIGGGSRDRYEIDINRFHATHELDVAWTLAGELQHEQMSGASPWYTLPDENGNPLQFMTGATIDDNRTELTLSAVRQLGQREFAVQTTLSEEKDYESASIGASYSFELTDRSATVSVAADLSDDEWTPVDADDFDTRPASATRDARSLLLTYAPIINASAVAQLSVGGIWRSGFLSDPYKVVFIDGEFVGDARPDERSATTMSARLRYFVDPVNAALHADYRFYSDDWGIDSHTLEFAWHQNLANGHRLVPSLRLYSQTAADFYDVLHDQPRADGLRTTDYRLSEFGAMALALRWYRDAGDWSFNVGVEHYTSDGDLFLADADVTHPGLVEFNVLSAGLVYSL